MRGIHAFGADLRAVADQRAAPYALVGIPELHSLGATGVTGIRVVAMHQRDRRRAGEFRIETILRARGIAQQAVDALRVVVILVHFFRRLQELALRERLVFLCDQIRLDRRKLVSDEIGLIDRKDYGVVPPKVEYRLTRMGQSFVPVISIIQEWGVRHLKADRVRAALDEWPDAIEALNALEPGRMEETPQGAAAHLGCREILEEMLARGVKLDIFMACALGWTAEVTELLRRQPGLANARGAHGIHVLNHACDRRTAQLLLEYGADPETPIYLPWGWTPIHEAASREANIIFGAVVDPKLEGRVKVTVIATGFEPAVARQPVASGSHTPIDLQHYTSHLKEKTEAAAMEHEHPNAAAALGAPLGRLSFARRPALDLAAAMPPPAPSAAKSATDPGNIDLDALSAFDVPAFLRREG